MLLSLRKTAFASAALVLAAALSSCGFDPATDRENTIAVGATDRSGDVDVLAATVVAAESGEAVLIAGLANNDRSEEAALTSVTHEPESAGDAEGDGGGATEGGDAPSLTIGEFDRVSIDPLRFTTLSEDPLTVEGEPEPGTFVRLTFTFDNGDQVTVKAPVVANCGPYADLPGLPGGSETCEVAEREEAAH